MIFNSDWSFYNGKQPENGSVRDFDRKRSPMRSSSEHDLANIVYAKPSKGGKRNDAYTGSPDHHRRPITQDMVRVLPDDHRAPSQRLRHVPAHADNPQYGRGMSEPVPDYNDRHEPVPDYGLPDSPRADHRRQERSRDRLDMSRDSGLVCAFLCVGQNRTIRLHGVCTYSTTSFSLALSISFWLNRS